MTVVYCLTTIHVNGCTVNPLTTNNAFLRHQILAAWCQLVQSVLKIHVGSALAERVGRGEVGRCHPEGDSAWQLLQLAIEKPWSMAGLPVLLLSCTNEYRKRSFHLVGTSFLAFMQLLVRRSVHWSEHPDYWMLGNESVVRVMKNSWRELWIKFLRLTPGWSGNTGERRWN